MMLESRKTWVILLLFVLIAVTAGCSRKPKPVITPSSSTTTEPAKPPEPVKPVETPPPATPKLAFGDIYFEYDKFNLSEESRAALNENGKFLSETAGAGVLLEGHCDERGTVEYNLALGQKRADSARNYLIQYGIDASRMSTISYGEEKPFAQGHDDSAWAQNRRVHFVAR